MTPDESGRKRISDFAPARDGCRLGQCGFPAV